MAEDLLLTKLFVPQLRRSFTPRPHLIKKLDAGLDGKLTLISAPAGFGKTTLISSWARQNERPIAWLSLDEGDSDPTRFLTYIIATLNRLAKREANIGEGVLALLRSPQPPPIHAVLTALLNEIAAFPEAIILVLDDYYLIEGLAIQDVLTFLLEHLPPQFHLVIVTRDDPQLPLARLRARGHLLELRAADLRFSLAEVGEFLNRTMKLDLPAEEIAALETRTEGWIAGLQLAALALQGQISSGGHEDAAGLVKTFTGSHRYILDYLIEEVLEQQPASVQTFLLQTAVLQRLSGSLCDALTGQTNGQATLESLEHANLFIIPLDNERRWYRYHHLFADLLRQQLRQKHPQGIRELHRRASEWYLQNALINEAVEHALLAEDFQRASRLIEPEADHLWQQGKHAQLRRWLAKLPVEIISTKPHLCIFHAWYLFAGGQQDTAVHILQAAEEVDQQNHAPTNIQTAHQPAQITETDSMRIRGRIATVRAFIATFRSDVPAIIEQAQLALDLLPQEDITWRSSAAITLGDAYAFQGDMSKTYQARLAAAQACEAAGNPYFIMVANMKLAITMRAQGNLQQIIEMCRQQTRLAQEKGYAQASVLGWCSAILGEVLAETNELDEALRQAKKGIELVEQGADLAMLGWSHICLLRVLFSRRDITEIEAIMQKMSRVLRGADAPSWVTSQIAVWQARLWLEQGKHELAYQWATERWPDVIDAKEPLSDTDYFLLIEYVTLARILLSTGRLTEAAYLLDEMFIQAEARAMTTRMIETLILQALVLQAGGEMETAVTKLEQALTLAEPHGFMRTFVDEGSPMARLLYETLSRDIAPNYVRQLLAAFPVTDPEENQPAPADDAEFAWIEPLSEREIDVLQLIADGLSNKEISSRLYLSLNTIKTHTRNIYSKLGVNSRLQAVSRARDLEILSPT